MAMIPEQEGVITSPTEPTKNRRKYWHQKGKNLFNYRSAKYINGYIDVDAQKIVASNASLNHQLTYIRCAPNTTYTISKQAGHAFRIATTEIEPDIGVGYLQTMADHEATSITITTASKAKYLAFICFSGGEEGTYIDMYKTVMVEKGSTATTYEDYINKIYIKNDYGEYEEIKPKINVMTGIEFETNFTRNGKTVYGKEINFGALPNNTTKQVEHGISDNFKLIKMQCSFENSQGVKISFDSDGINPSHGTTAVIFGYISKYHIVLVTNHNASDYAGTVTIFYTKN